MSGGGRDVAIAGVGYSTVYRGPSPNSAVLAVTACKNAMDDAGLKGPDIDGIFEYKFGTDSPNCVYVQQALGVPDLAAYADIMGTGPSGLAGALAAVMAVGSGACETAIAYRAISEAAGNTGTARGAPVEDPGGAPFYMQFSAPYGLFALIPNMGLKMQRRIHELGGTIEDYGHIAVNARKWAAKNERAVLRNLITMDDYLSSRILADPLHLLDCDYPVSGCCAVIVTTAERARAMRKTPVYVDAMAFATGSGDWVHGEDFLFGATQPCAERLWKRASVSADDVSVAELYDGFTHITISWIEALGLCGVGEFGDWVDGGRRIGPGGSLPLNTHGGQLAEGRLHGLAFLTEAVLQLRGECGDRQVPDAQVAVVANAHGAQCGAMVLRAG